MGVTTKYAAQYTLRPRIDGAGVGTLLAAALDQWHAKKRMDFSPLSWDSPSSGELEGGGFFRWAPYAEDGEAIADYTLNHPDSQHPSVFWTTHFSYRAQHDEASTSPYAGPLRYSLTAEVAVDGRSDLVARKRSSRPALIAMLDEVFALGDGDLEFRKDARELVVDEIGDFVKFTLEDPHRTFPIVVLSEQRGSGYAVNPAALATEYFGVAHLYTIGWRAALALSAELGPERSVFNGAMRVYFPGFTRSASISAHPLVPARQMTDRIFQGRLSAAMAQETVAHFDIAQARPSKLAQRRVLAYDASRLRMAKQLKNTIPAAEIRAYDDLMRVYESDAKAAIAELDAANALIAQLTSKVASLRYALTQATGGTATDTPSAVEALVAEDAPTTVREAVERAMSECRDTLEFLPSAFETAEESGYTQPGVVLEYLQTMGNIVERKRDGTLGCGLKDAFAERGVDYSPKNADNTKGKLRNQYRFKKGDEVYECNEHLRRGNDPALGLRIYFTSETDDGRFVIGHIGRHLDTNTTN